MTVRLSRAVVMIAILAGGGRLMGRFEPFVYCSGGPFVTLTERVAYVSKAARAALAAINAAKGPEGKG